MLLVLSLSLVAAVPVAADPGYAGYTLATSVNSTATWDDTEQEFGSYSVKLVNVDARSYVEFIPAPGTTMSDLASGEWGFWSKSIGVHAQPNMELRFTAPDFDPTLTGEVAGRGHADVNITNYDFTGAWETEDATLNDRVYTYWNDPTDGTAGNNWGEGNWTTLALTLAAIDGDGTMTAGNDSAADWELTRVQIDVWDDGTSYIDDITINGTLYELEPIFLDAEYYSVGDTVEVTVPNFAANTDSIRINPVAANCDTGVPRDNWTVTATSDSDPGAAITVALEETGANTGVFRGSFATTNTVPVAEDEVYVEDGDTITVTYLTSDDDWGTGVESTTIITAKVDDTAPTITGLTPADDAMTVETAPTISATYSDDTAGIDETSVEMLLDDVDVTDDAVADGDDVTYTPTEDLAEGSHDVTVNVSDNAGNAATESWSFRIVSWLAGPESATDEDLDALDTVGVAVSITGDTSTVITVGRYASNPEPDAALTFSLIENGFFDVQVTGTDTATQIVIKFADPAITAESTAYVWDDLQGMWLACSDQGYNPTDEFLWVKVRDDTIPNIAELEGTPFAISAEAAPPEDILDYYRGYSGDAEVVETTDLLKAANDWANAVVPPNFTEPISTTQLLTLANEWAAS